MSDEKMRDGLTPNEAALLEVLATEEVGRHEHPPHALLSALDKLRVRAVEDWPGAQNPATDLEAEVRRLRALVRDMACFLPYEKPEQGPLPEWIDDIRHRGAQLNQAPWPTASCCGEPCVARQVDRCYDHAKVCATCDEPSVDGVCPACDPAPTGPKAATQTPARRPPRRVIRD